MFRVKPARKPDLSLLRYPTTAPHPPGYPHPFCDFYKAFFSKHEAPQNI